MDNNSAPAAYTPPRTVLSLQPRADGAVDMSSLDAAIASQSPKAEPPASPELVARAPALTRQAIEQVFEVAAQQVELAADAVMQQAIDTVATAKETAKALRDKGAREAASVERAATMARDSTDLFKAHMAKVIGAVAEAA